MAIPSECKMPDLSGLDSPLISRLIVPILVGEPGLSRKAQLYRRNFIRLLDKALREYHEAREAILATIAEEEEIIRRITYMIAFTDHIETCINAVSRLFKLLYIIKTEKEAPTFPKPLLKLVETKYDSIANLRNAVEHMDEQIHNGEVTPGNPIMLTISKNGDYVVVSEDQMKFEDLAMVLKKMHEVALYVLTNKKVEAAELPDEIP